MGRSSVRREKEITAYVEVSSGLIKRVVIGGDFFAFPEGKIDELQSRLVGVHLDEVRKVVDNVLKDCELVGIEKEDLVEAVIRASELNCKGF